jgi:hypothetical protein
MEGHVLQVEMDGAQVERLANHHVGGSWRLQLRRSHGKSYTISTYYLQSRLKKAYEANAQDDPQTWVAKLI